MKPLDGLQVTPTADLIKELRSRFPVVLVLTDCPTEGIGGASFHFHGGVSACLGLVERLKSLMLSADACQFGVEEWDEDEDGGEDGVEV
jgi:hypothetical protein